MKEEFKEFLIMLGLHTDEHNFHSRLLTVREWWGIWGIAYFQLGYESKEEGAK